MAEWRPITRESPEVEGIDPKARGLLLVRVALDREPPSEWEDFFLSMPKPPEMHAPRISGDEILIRPPDAELEAYVHHLDERIKAANEFYAREIVPGLKAEHEEADADERRLGAARDRAKKL